ncbi:TPA: hypothetical protein DD690_02075 [Candidatus Daviesbacteria bacterium]|uniref:Uncharacterized protein n=1 Tax=Candidatus Daviesbacteria bacterium GW2011_GWF2_38_6 TaxID=1618432 RepID=A0A0G0MRG3_9BACT|nr:MAG: hypothetical protein US99_C0079G0002 [Candidatus Daviesbacteria bacterium GW2011_GWF2_38_6]OGE26615.1 MAG: hypothetical protein A3D02_01020 [Candidatus Daviesbacteria bacterium RIFCSPHIGHO2_02_FULL_39_41]OGE28351.1 MAG: hypothetical protein A2772_01770 [Candidatus Daviesbacteria bacterium RIFCSPHIGHO2_01_FULL_38_8b]OGE45676.1 MAG: hypothetical protein A3E67_05145 [Candidatus Daviesbacteria bacterium RIFCSPHIGHO2_12_FULL_38_25]OGE68816.1 MAG: hypothetical protein A3H81_01500 [Candidatus 
MSNGKSTLQIFILIGCCLILAGLIITYPKPTQAEIATAKDWIGFFPVGATDGKTNTVNGNSWVYTNSCTKTAGADPKLTNLTGCSFALNPIPTTGNYEFRIYANDQETDGALIAKSNTISSTAASPTPGPAVNCPTQTAYPRVQDGLITTPLISDNFGNSTANCVLGSPAPFAPFKIPTYDDLKSLYYDQSKAGKKNLPSNSALTSNQLEDQKVHYTDGSLEINNQLSYAVTAVVFVKDSFSIKKSITGSPGAGLVFVVGGNVNIDTNVSQIDAVIISQGIIYTAGSGCSTNAVPASALTINGSLISLNTIDNVPIKFCRTLDSSNSPAEIIINQPKYLVILRNILSDTYQKWSEIQ